MNANEIFRVPKSAVVWELIAGVVIAAGLLPLSALAQTPSESTVLEEPLEPEIEALQDQIAAQEDLVEILRLIDERRRLEQSLLDLQLAKVRGLVAEGKKAEASVAMKEFKLAMAHFELSHAALKNFPSRLGVATTSETFRDQDYIGVLIENGVNVFNSLRLDRPARVRYLLNEQLLSLIKEFAQAADGAGTYGLLVSLEIPFRNFLDEDEGVRYDTLRLYIPIAEIKRFTEYAITGQDLVDASVIIVNDNRVAITLE